MKDEYTYGGVTFHVDQAVLAQAERQYREHLHDVMDEEVDGTGEPWCGCDVCGTRVALGYWVSWAVAAMRAGELE